MSWIQENKFVAGLGGVTAVLAGAIFYFGNSQGNQYDEKLEEYNSLKAENKKLLKAKPFPDAGNREAREENIAKYESTIEDVKNTFASFSAGELASISPEEFNNRRDQMEKKLLSAFTGAGTTLPEKTAFGFEKYATEAVKSNATATLGYQMGALDWLFSELAKVKPAELANIRRDELAVEKGVQAAPTPQRRGSSRGRRGPAAQEEKAYTLMPVELTFTASEASLREFLKAMVNSKEYFYSIRALRIRNEKQTPPNIKDAEFPPEDLGGGGNPFPGGMGLPEEGEDAGGGAVPVVEPGQRILKQVLGDEKLHVFIRFDVVLIKGSKGATEEGNAEEKPAP